MVRGGIGLEKKARIFFEIPTEIREFRLDNVSFREVEIKKTDSSKFFRIEWNDTDAPKTLVLK